MLQSVSVKDYMTASVITLEPEMDVLKAINILLSNGISGAPVLDPRGNVLGLLSEKDCIKVALRAGYHEEWGGEVREFMTAKVESVDADASILTVAKMFVDKPYKRYPVMSDNRLVGTISRRDVLKAIEAIR